MPVPPPTFEARLVAARMVARHVRELTFERTDGAPMHFQAGQWVNLMLDESKRSYSIASPPRDAPRFELAVTRVTGGPASTWLHEVAPGATMTFIGPQGFFTRPLAPAPPSLMVATGTGVAPLRSMIHAAIAAGSREPMWLLLGVRHEEDALYSDELREIARAHPFVRFEATLSRPREDWRGRRGWVQAHVPALWDELARATAGEGAAPHAYVCGLERMVGSVRQMLRKEMGLPRERVHTERYD